MKIQEIYDKYNIMPSLQLHMMRVASVAQIICDNITNDSIYQPKLVCDDIIKACLLHDMGNIIKFDLSFDEKLLQPQSQEYWEKIKQEFIEKYGNKERVASVLIAKEIGVNSNVIEIIKSIGYVNAKIVLDSNDFNKMICLYSDKRVSPAKIVDLKDSLLQGIKRHMMNKKKLELDLVQHDEMAEAIVSMEWKIFANSEIQPTNINDESVNRVISSKTFQKLDF